MHDTGGQREEVQQGVLILHRLVLACGEAVLYLVPRTLVAGGKADHHVRLPRALLEMTRDKHPQEQD